MEEVIIHCYTLVFKYLISVINFSKQNYLDSAALKSVIPKETIIFNEEFKFDKS